MTCHAYLFEARSIQHYILASGRLAEMVGASKIIDGLTAETLDAALATLGLREASDTAALDTGRVAFSRREGGVFVALLSNEATASRLRALWTLVVQNVAPGLEWVDAQTSGATFREAVEAGYLALARRRNQPTASLPETTPCMRVAQRTGEAAVKRGKGNEWRDGPGMLKHEASKADSLLRGKFIPEARQAEGLRYIFPRELTPTDESRDYAFPFAGAERNVAIIHADGNGLGLILNALRKALAGNPAVEARYLAIYRGFSDAIGEATREAARMATEQILIPHARHSGQSRTLPARPLVLAGDDLNVIVRADLALDFARVFLEAFESQTAVALATWKQRALGDLSVPGLPDRLTACAGVVFCGANQPFASAYALAEELCKAAKHQAGAHKAGDLKPGGFVFHRITTSFIDTWQDIVAETLTLKGSESDQLLSLGLYGVGETAAQTRLPPWTGLEQLQQELSGDALSHGAMRELAMLMHQSPELMRQRYARWRENIVKSKSAGKRKLDQIDSILAALGVEDPRRSPFTGDPKVPATPIGDVITLMSIRRSAVPPAASRESEAHA